MARDYLFDKKSFTFTWILDNFEYCEQKTGSHINSPTFIVASIERSKWSLTLYPRGKKWEDWISVFLWREADSKGPPIIDLHYELAIQTMDGEVLAPENVRSYSFAKHSYNGIPSFTRRDDLFTKRSTFLPQGALTIRCRMWKWGGEVCMDGCSVARTRFKVEKKAFLWKLSNFSAFSVGQEDTIRLKSTLDDSPLVSLKLFLRKNIDAIIIKFLPSDERIITFKFSLITAQSDFVECGQSKFYLSPNMLGIEYLLSLSKNTLIDNKSLYLPNNTLTLSCELAFSSGTVSQELESTAYGSANSFITNKVVPANKKTADIKKPGLETSDLKIAINSMLEDKVLCDVKLCVESETFSAHWFILSARSPVFRAMFQSDMKEKLMDEINIYDLKPNTVCRLLLYMYTDSVGELQWETAADLYFAADKYQIMTLKDKCSSFLKSNVSLSNACRILHISDLVQDEELKSIVQSFILKNDKSIINSSEWKQLMEDNVNVAAETMYLKFKE